METIASPTPIDTSMFADFAAPVVSAQSRNIVERVVPETEKESGQTYRSDVQDDYTAAYREVEEREAKEYREPETREREESTQQDLNEYYSKLAAGNYISADYSHADPVAAASSGVKQSAANLQNAMIEAVQKGMSIEHACNIRSAKAAYEANVKTLKSTISISA